MLFSTQACVRLFVRYFLHRGTCVHDPQRTFWSLKNLQPVVNFSVGVGAKLSSNSAVTLAGRGHHCWGGGGGAVPFTGLWTARACSAPGTGVTVCFTYLTPTPLTAPETGAPSGRSSGLAPAV